MATSKLLQKPSIIQIIGSTIRIAHPDISGYTRTSVGAPIAAAGTALTVVDNNNFEDNDWFIIGEVGDGKTEECDVNGAVTRGTSLTITNTLKFAHELDAPVTRIYERKFILYGAATDGGTGTVITSVGASGKDIQWDKPYTEWTLASTDTTYAYYYVTFYDGTTASSASDYVLAAGLTYNTVEEIIMGGVNECGDKIGGRITREFLLEAANDWQDTVTNFVDENGIVVSWGFELTEDNTSIASTENENKYALSDLSFTLKDTNTAAMIQSIKFGRNLLEYVDIDEFDKLMENTTRTTLNGDVAEDATEVTLTDSYEFAEGGVIHVGEDSISYTANTETTGVLSGCTGVDNAHTDGDTVWQGVAPGLPTKYTIREGYLYLNAPIDSDYVGQKIKIRGYKKLDRFTEYSDAVTIPFTHLGKKFIAAKIEELKGNNDLAQTKMNSFFNQLSAQAKRTKSPTLETNKYHNFNWDI